VTEQAVWQLKTLPSCLATEHASVQRVQT